MLLVGCAISSRTRLGLDPGHFVCSTLSVDRVESKTSQCGCHDLRAGRRRDRSGAGDVRGAADNW